MNFADVTDWQIPTHYGITEVKDSSNNVLWKRGINSSEPLAFNRFTDNADLCLQLWNLGDIENHQFFYKFEGQDSWTSISVANNDIENIYFRDSNDPTHLYNKLYIKHIGTLSKHHDYGGHMLIGTSIITATEQTFESTYLTGNILSLVCDTNGNYDSLTTIPEYGFYSTSFDGVISAEYAYFPSFVSPHCYHEMFYNNQNLIKGPALPATILTDYCYYRMFYNCQNLNYIKCTATNITAQNCTYDWLHQGNIYNQTGWSAQGNVYYVSFSQTVPNDGNTIYVKFNGDVPHSSTYSNCRLVFNINGTKCSCKKDNGDFYYFNIDGNLSSNYLYKFKFKVISSSNQIFIYEGTTGTFVKKAGVTWPAGSSGIPNGWTIEEV